MYIFLLSLIYIAFIQPGLTGFTSDPAVPVMHTELGVPVSYMGIVSMVIWRNNYLESSF